MKALVLSGGSIKGAFQAGAIRWILEQGFVPDLVYGISVGALNGAFLADRSGDRVRRGEPVDWPAIGRELEAFWTKNVTSPRDLIKRRGTLSLVTALALNRFDGLTATDPLRRMIHREVNPTNLAASPIRFEAGAVNMEDGEIIYARQDWPDIREYIHASTAIPIVMPMVDVPAGEREVPFYDGGVRDIAPLGRAIDMARQEGKTLTEIVIIVCQPERITGGTFRRGSVLDLAGRLMEIVSTEIVENDLRFVRWINKMLASRAQNEAIQDGKTYHRVRTCLIRPERDLDVAIDDFRTDDLRSMFAQGRKVASEEYPPSIA